MKSFLIQVFLFFSHFGGLGLLVLGILDSSFLFMPLGNDLLIVAMTANHPAGLPFYAAMAAAGSVLGCALVDWVSRKGGEAGLEQTIAKRRLEYVKRKVKKNAAIALAVGSIMPPPFPFTALVAAAAAFQYPRKKLLTVIGAMRLVRFTALGLLALVFGRRILEIAQQPVVQSVILAIVAVCVVGSALSVYRWIRRSRRPAAKPVRPVA